MALSRETHVTPHVMATSSLSVFSSPLSLPHLSLHPLRGRSARRDGRGGRRQPATGDATAVMAATGDAAAVGGGAAGGRPGRDGARAHPPAAAHEAAARGGAADGLRGRGGARPVEKQRAGGRGGAALSATPTLRSPSLFLSLTRVQGRCRRRGGATVSARNKHMQIQSDGRSIATDGENL